MTRVALAPTVLAVLLCGCDPLTAVLVRIDNGNLDVPGDAQRIRITVTNPREAGAPEVYRSQDLTLCGPDRAEGCSPFPISLTLYPGPAAPRALVRIAVDVYGSAATPVLSEAALFAFTEGYSQHIDFALHKSCLANACAARDQACDAAGDCVSLTPAPPAGAITRISATARAEIGVDVEVGPPIGVVAGDVVIVAVRVPLSNIRPRPPVAGGWTSAGEVTVVNDRGGVFYRIADDSDATDPARYRFTSDDSAAGLQRGFNWVTTSYRGARKVEPKLASLLDGQPATLPSFSSTEPDTLLLGYLQPESNTACQAPSGVVDFRDYFPVDWGAFDERLPAAGPSGTRTIACTTGNNGAYVLLLSP